MVTLHLVRHATYHLVGHALGGRGSGLPLNEAGRSEAARVAAGLAARDLAAVVSSPQLRARETAEPIAAPRGIVVEVDDGFDEIDFGDWTGRDFASLAPSPEWRAFNTLRSFSQVPGGEAAVAVQARAVAAAMRLASRHSDREAVVVSHCDVIRSLLAYALGMPLDLSRRLEVAPGSRSVLVLFDEDVRVDAVNLPA